MANGPQHPEEHGSARQPHADESEAVPATPGAALSEPIFNLPAIVVILGAACIAVHAVRVYLLTPDQDFELLVRTAFIPVRYSGEYVIDVWAFTSPVTYAFLHGGLAHLFLNMIWFAAFGSPLANRLGTSRMLGFWIAASVGAVLLHYVVHPLDEAPVIGASGAISGMMGAAARYGFRIDRSSGRSVFSGAILPIGVALRLRPVAAFLIVWFGLNLLSGLAGFIPEVGAAIAWEAHIGGFLVGFLGIGLFDRRAITPAV